MVLRGRSDHDESLKAAFASQAREGAVRFQPPLRSLEHSQQVGFGPSSGFCGIRGERRDASKKGCAPRSKKTATGPLNEFIGLLPPSEACIAGAR